jgi:hypothetical protein
MTHCDLAVVNKLQEFANVKDGRQFAFVSERGRSEARSPNLIPAPDKCTSLKRRFQSET